MGSLKGTLPPQLAALGQPPRVDFRRDAPRHDTRIPSPSWSQPLNDRDDLPTEALPSDFEEASTARRGPALVGPYRLLHLIGEGGMGEVWEAEQIRPIRRRVAVKVIKKGLDTKEVLARFEAERQALALMDHPAIAKVLDAGETERGRPYFVMELVRGVPITLYCDRRRLSNRQRLEIFAQVCQGVQHAHQKAVIHRDLKPSNILVTEHDGRPMPKIIDFGVAKALAQRLSEQTLFTQHGQLLGTPEYMSPEQAEMSSEDVDTRTDVYSLGVLLYALLVGALPFESQELRKAGYDEIRRQIREVEPPRPSTRISSLGEKSSTCAHSRRTNPAHLVSELRGDLDWITMRAMEKDRNRRYGSPTELADDVQRYLRYEPVVARPPSVAYRARKFVRRHRGAVAAASLVLLALLAGFTIALWGWRKAALAETQARQEATTARRVSEFLVDLFERADPGHSRGAEVTVREVLDQGARAIATGLREEPATRASLLETLGEVHTVLGLYDEAQQLLEQAKGIRDAQGEGHELERARALVLLANAQLWRGELEAGLASAQESLSIRERELGEKHPEVADVLNTLGNLREQSGAYEKAEALHARAAAIRQIAFGPDSEELAKSLHNLGIALFQQGEYADARRSLEDSARIEEKRGGDDNYGLATSLHVLAIVHQKLGEIDEALVAERRALAIRERVLGPDHPHVAFSLTTLAQLLQSQGKTAAAEPLLRRAVSIGEASWSRTYPEVRWMRRELAACLADLERGDEAETILLDLIRDTEEAKLEDALTPTLNALGKLYTRQGRASEARAVLERSLEIESRVSGIDHPYVVDSLLPLIELHRELGEDEETRSLCERALGIVRESMPEEQPERVAVEASCAAS